MSKKTIRLKKTADFSYHGDMSYHVVHLPMAGMKDRFDVLVRTASGPIRIGNELDLKSVRALIAEYESGPAFGYMGSMIEAKKIVAFVQSRQETRRLIGGSSRG